MQIIKLDEVDSTNNYAKDKIKTQLNDTNFEDFIVLSRIQNAGRGSKGRSFYSPNTGLYFTYATDILTKLSPNELTEDFQNTITPKVAVAVYRTLNKLYKIDTKIKWINDLYLCNKKICGILTESISYPKYLIVGIGINLIKPKNIPDDIDNIFGYIFENEQDAIINKKNIIETKNIIVKNIISELQKIILLKNIPKEYYERRYL